jgi:SEC-C motif-containing protein
MRSRYCAYVCRDTAYLLRTWDPAHRPPGLDLKDDRTQWLGLRIVTTVAGGPTDPQGEVEFIARFRSSDGEGQLHERSRFRRAGEAWLYVDGDIRPATQASRQKSQPVFSQPTVGRNDPCPCGSGKKWKRCCGM